MVNSVEKTNKPRVVWLVFGLLAAGLAVWLLRSRPVEPERAAAPVAVVAQEQAVQVEARPEVLSAGVPAPGINAAPAWASRPAGATNWLQALLGADGEARLEPVPREQIERWLQLNGTNVESLLAARQCGDGPEHLHRALTNYPNDPRVLFGALSLNDSPEAKRERLDRFKAAAPDNALADYLSARDHFLNARPEEAVRDLVAAARKGAFQDYTLDAMQNAEELLLAAGKSPAEAKVLGQSSVLLPHLAQLKGLAREMAALESQYLAAGDAASAEALAQHGLQLSQHLSQGEGSRFLINRLVGGAVERIVLQPLDSETSYDFLQGTVPERLAQTEGRTAETKREFKSVNQWLLQAGEADVASYFERVKIYGETSAMAWVKQRRASQ